MIITKKQTAMKPGGMKASRIGAYDADTNSAMLKPSAFPVLCH